MAACNVKDELDVNACSLLSDVRYGEGPGCTLCLCSVNYSVILERGPPGLGIETSFEY